METKRHLRTAALGAVLALVLGSIGASAAHAAPPASIGQDGQTVVTPGEVMAATPSVPHGQLEPGIVGSFYTAQWSGSSAGDKLITRYFESGAAPVAWDTTLAPGVTGKVYSISTDAAGTVYSLNRTSATPSTFTISSWQPDGAFVSAQTLAIPGITSGHTNGMAVTPDGSRAYVRVDWAMPAALNGVWVVDLASGAVTPVVQGLPQSVNPEQSPWMQVDPVSGAIGFSLDTQKFGIIADPTSGAITEYSTAPDMIRGLDISRYSAGTITVSAGGTISEYDVASGGKTTLARQDQLDWFNPYSTRWGTDGRLYVAGFSPWGVLPVELSRLQSPEISYPNTSFTTNLCAPESVTLTPELAGSPAPSWVSVAAGVLPDGLTLDPETGGITGTPSAAGSATLRAENGVSPIAGSAPDTATLTFETVTEPVPFEQTPAPELSGTPTVGKVLTASPAAWTPAAEQHVQWLRDGEPIAGATELSYTLVAADAGHKISVRASGEAECRQATGVTSTAMAVSAEPGGPGGPGGPGEPGGPGKPGKPGGPGTAGSGGKTPGLAVTGAAELGWLAAGGIALLAAGALVIGRRALRAVPQGDA